MAFRGWKTWEHEVDRPAWHDQRVLKKSTFVKEKGGKCSSCNGVFPLCCYDFHHLDAADNLKEKRIAWTLSLENLRIRLKGCILLCANCHRIAHHDK